VIVRSPYGDVGIPKIPFHEFVLGRAEQRENALAFIDPDAQCRVTFGELARDARRIAAGLAQRGMRKGDVFALMLPNVPEFATAFFGVPHDEAFITARLSGLFYQAEGNHGETITLHKNNTASVRLRLGPKAGALKAKVTDASTGSPLHRRSAGDIHPWLVCTASGLKITYVLSRGISELDFIGARE
jgi:AMP-binding enzyme